jgi:hypothetical protein
MEAHVIAGFAGVAFLTSMATVYIVKSERRLRRILR